MSWREFDLESLCSQVTSGGTPSTSRPEYYGGAIPWLRTQEVNFNRIWDTELAITEDGLANSAAKWIPENSVLVAMYGNSAGRVATNQIPLTTNQACCNLTPDETKADYRFIYYRLMLDYDVLHKMAKGAAQNNLNAGQIRSYRIRAPHVLEQGRIADILSVYDDLIENNRRRMVLLEEAARQLYREWFVRLRFPGHEHARVTNGVPEGWARLPVAALTNFLNRGIAPQYDDDAEGLVINQKCIRAGRLDLSLARHQSREFKPERQVQPGDVLVNSTGEGTLGRVAQVLAPIDNCTVDTHVTIVRPAPSIGVHFFGQALMEWEPRFSTMGRGATNQTELSREQIGGVQILVPPRSLVQQFDEVAASAFRQAWILTEQNDKLRSARNLLLPRLMSGEIAV
jgi:type I restriction enzyme S subunit